MTILIIDGANALHIAKSGFQQGDHFLAYNFFRNLKALVETHKPTRAIITREGRSFKKTIAPSYKENRLAKTEQEVAVKQSFYEKTNEIYDIIDRCLPISIMRHPEHEADDVIANIIASSSTITDWLVSSTDTDFIQLLQKHSNVKLWNPIKKSFVENPAYDYIIWKSLHGDGSDNIKGLAGFGKVKAEKFAVDPTRLATLTVEQRDQFDLNKKLITFIDLQDKLDEIHSTKLNLDFDELASEFQKRQFNSILKESYWHKFKDVFQKLAV